MATIAVEYNMTFVSDHKMSHIKQAWPSLDLDKWR
jgi:hypothetical protein